MIMNTRITAPNPQHMQSRNDSEKAEIGLRATGSSRVDWKLANEGELALGSADVVAAGERARARGVGVDVDEHAAFDGGDGVDQAGKARESRVDLEYEGLVPGRVPYERVSV